jgi:hypothetical protein
MRGQLQKPCYYARRSAGEEGFERCEERPMETATTKEGDRREEASGGDE